MEWATVLADSPEWFLCPDNVKNHGSSALNFQKQQSDLTPMRTSSNSLWIKLGLSSGVLNC